MFLHSFSILLCGLVLVQIEWQSMTVILLCIFNLKVVMALSYMICFYFASYIFFSHIFLGISSCGQLLITYTYTTDFDDRPISFNTIFKYRLHWWAFVPYAEARKVAEVTLFGNYNVYSPLYLAYCQWPRDSTKIVVFGRR